MAVGPLSHATAIPPSWYVDPEFAALEREQIFGRGWHYVAPLDRLASVGDCWPHQLADEPILLTRSSPEHVTACSNVCRHRAAVLVDQPCRGADKIRCRYHGWTYDLAGNLRGVPEFDGVATFTAKRIRCQVFRASRLVRWSLSDWISRNVTRRQLPCRTSVGPIDSWLGRAWGRSHVCWSWRMWNAKTYRLACNWKVFVDNYLDGGITSTRSIPDWHRCLIIRVIIPGCLNGRTRRSVR